ncbi:MAG TPA: hypothetical protein VGJ78_05455 [Vicinamibacterales bacterium]
MTTCAASTVTGAGAGVNGFAKSWNGRRVIVKSALYTVLYDEIGRTGIHYHGKQAGLTIATPDGQYYEFDGPGSDENVVEESPDLVMSEMSTRFIRAYHLDIGIVKTITPLSLRPYEPGAILIVDSVKVDRNRVRFAFRRSHEAADGDDEFATSLTVEWPVPLSKTLREREGIEGVLERFIEPL